MRRNSIPGRDRRAGQILVFTTLNLFLLFSLVGLALDLGWSYFKKEQAQSAADGAALSAAVDALYRGFTCGTNGVVCASTYTCAYPNVSPATTVFQTGCLYAAANGFQTTGDQSVSLTGDTTAPPGSSGLTAQYWVKATVTDRTYNLLLYLAGFHTASIAAQSVAAVIVSPNGNCVYSLSPDAANAFQISGNVTVTSACGLYVNSNDPTTAINVKGGATVSGTQVQEVGGYTLGNNGTISPTPVHASAIPDPLISMPAPSYSGCDYTNFQASGSGTTTLNPGVYCGGIKLSGNGTINFNAGTYILDGGGFISSVGGTMNGSGVTFFNTFDATHAAGPVSISSNPVMTMSAPTSGTYMGILFYQDRNSPAGGWPAASITGSGASTVSGTFYFPSGELDYAGSTTGGYQAVISNTLKITGTTTFRNDPTGVFTGLISRRAALIQ
jgi:hypothetical protein